MSNCIFSVIPKLFTTALVLLSIVLFSSSQASDVSSDGLHNKLDDDLNNKLDNKQSLDLALQDLKKQVLALNRDLFILEEELMFPSNTQLAVFLSLDIGEFFKLDAVTVSVDKREVASHLYTDKQLDALIRGGVQRLYLGNIKSGEHEIVAVFTGRGPNDRDYRRATSFTFNKASDAKKLELLIEDSTRLYQPEFSVVEWN